MIEKIDLAAILTGGAAKRMGGRKADLPVNGVSLTELAYDSIAPLAHEVVCVGYVNPLSHLGIKAVDDLYNIKASIGGIATALDYAGKTIGADSYVLIVGCDMPSIKHELLELLISRRQGHDVVMPMTGFGPEPLCALYRAGIADVFRTNIEQGNLRIKNVLKSVKACILEESELRSADPDLSSFINVNRPEDLARVQTHGKCKVCA